MTETREALSAGMVRMLRAAHEGWAEISDRKRRQMAKGGT